jgi:ribonuclease Z
MVRIPGYGSVLLDAGEATWGQLVRHYGTDIAAENNVWDVLRDIKCIFISHIHGDHHLGLSKLLAMRNKVEMILVSKLTATHRLPFTSA